MVHTGKPSAACQGCKKRHIKCDETRPACKRCLAANRLCPGYKDGLDLVLRDQNYTAKALVERRSKAKAKSKSPSLEKDGVKQASPPVCTITSEALGPTIVESEDTHAFCLFMSSWVLYERDPRADRNIPECLTLMLSSLHVDSALSLAVNALARGLFRAWERRNRDLEGVVEIQKAYVTALEAVRTALSNPTMATSDETLMAVCLLGTYEALVGAFQGQLSKPRHFEGALAIISEKKAKRSMTPVTKRVLRAVQCHIAYRAMNNATKVDTKSDVWQDNDPTHQNPAHILDEMTAEVANILAEEKIILEDDYFSTAPPNEDDVKNKKAALLDEAYSVDASLSLWPTLVPANWHPIPIPAEEIPKSVADSGLYGHFCHVYPDVIVCSTWNDWRTARIRTLSLIARLEPGGASLRTLNAIQQMVDDICASVPFCLGSRTTPAPMYANYAEYPSIKGRDLPKDHHTNAALFGGWWLVCCLKETLSLFPYLDKAQFFWIMMQLRRCATIYDVTPKVPHQAFHPSKSAPKVSANVAATAT